jgi:hypothetical protein
MARTRRRGATGATAGLIVLVVTVVGFAQYGWQPAAGGLRRAVPRAVSGDEPHYLVVTHSLLFDGDLDLRNQYAAVTRGDAAAGARARWRRLDHHTVLVDARSGRAILWHTVYDFTRPAPCGAPGCTPFALRRPYPFADPTLVAEPPAHPPAFPILTAAVLRPFRLLPEQVESAVAGVVLATVTGTLVLTFALALRVGLGPGWSLAAAAILGLASPMLPYVRSFFAETTGALLLALALHAFVAGSIALAATAAAAAMTVKPAFALVGAAWIVERWLARDRGAAALLLAVHLAVGILLLIFNRVVLGDVLIAGSLGWEGATPGGLVLTLVSPYHGLLPFVPWVVLCAPALSRRGRAATVAPAYDRLRRAVVAAVPPYYVLTGLAGGLGASAYGPRYWVALLPWFAVLAAATLRASAPRPRALGLALVLLGALVAVPGVLLYAEVWDAAPHAALRRLLGW